MSQPTAVPVPEVDYTATSLRPTWDALPEGVRRAVADAAGSPVVRAERPPGSGFTAGFASVLHLADGRRVFAKAAWAEREHLMRAYRQEARVLAVLPEQVPAPRLVAEALVPGAEADGQDWQLLVTTALGGRLPQPWTERDVAAAHDACLAVAEALTPVPAAVAEVGIASLAEEVGRDSRSVAFFTRLAAGEATLTWGQPAWVHDRADDLAALVDRSAALIDGQTGCHADLRADNLLVDGERAWVVDWNWLCVGAAWTDFVGLLPLARADGVDVEAWLARSELTRGADPEAIDAWLAVIAAYMLASADDPVWPGGLDAIRRHQRRYARTFLDWLALRRRWA